jgi:uncharacterized protein YndB with AHSA1/START domain
MFRYMGASVSAVLTAPIERVWPIVGDVTRHAELAGSGEVQSVRLRDAAAPAAGVVFESHQRMRGITYTTANRIIEWDPPHRLVWRVGFPFAPGIAQVWHFRLLPSAGGTRVENAVALIYALPETFPLSPLHDAMGRGYAASMTPTLDNLARMLGVQAPIDRRVQLRPPHQLTALLPPPNLMGGLLLGGLAAGAVATAAVIRQILR